jgi:predicted dehydrogenase
MFKKVSIGLVGCGAAGKIHAKAIADSDHAELRWVEDCNARAAQQLGQRHQVPWATELERFLDDPSLDAVSLAVPHHLHLELASRVALAGKHILLEKPFTLNVAQAHRLVALCREQKVTLVPWMERRFLPYAGSARELVASGELGQVVYTRVCTLGYKPRAYWAHGMRCEEYPSSWRSTLSASGGGILLMNGIHQIDLMRYVSGLTPAEVFARVATMHHEVEVEDLALVNVRYGSGALGVIEASCCTYGVGQFPIEGPADSIMGTDGHLAFGTPLRCFDRIRFSRQFEFPKLSVMDMKMRLLENFARHIREGEDLRCKPSDAISALAVIEAAYRSAARSAPISVEEVLGKAAVVD